MAGCLDRAGEERFLTRAAKFLGDLTLMEPSQSLYQGIMVALGYSKNKLPFLELARKVPLGVLEAIVQGEVSDEECLARQQALLLGVAGLLPSQREGTYPESKLAHRWIDTLERAWDSADGIRVMSANAWHLFRVRPNNSPVRRLAAMSYLILRYREKGILTELVGLVQETPVGHGYHALEKGLLVTTGGCGASHSDFGSSSRIESSTLVGRGRAADIVVNVLLPFTFAWSRFTSQPELERKALDLYYRYPRLAVNSVDRHMMYQLGLSCDLVDSARRQQGLTHIYNSFCTQGRCDCCVLAQYN